MGLTDVNFFPGNVRVAMQDRFPPVFSFAPLWSLQVATLAIFIGVSTSDDNAVMRTVGYSCIDASAASLLVLVLLAPQSRLCDVLRFPPLVYIGQISFGLYLLHEPTAYLVRSAIGAIVPLHAGDSWNLPTSLVAAFVAAWFSWTFFESKLLNRRSRSLQSSPTEA